jgi:hypothetical protein
VGCPRARPLGVPTRVQAVQHDARAQLRVCMRQKPSLSIHAAGHGTSSRCPWRVRLQARGAQWTRGTEDRSPTAHSRERELKPLEQLWARKRAQRLVLRSNPASSPKPTPNGPPRRPLSARAAAGISTSSSSFTRQRSLIAAPASVPKVSRRLDSQRLHSWSVDIDPSIPKAQPGQRTKCSVALRGS